jgi:DNA ligase-1
MTFKPTLACEADLENLKFPLFASPKLDGIRCSIVNGKALTRTLKEVPNRTVFNNLSNPSLSGLDGELIVGPPNASDVYRTTVSGIMSRDDNPDYAYYVFDYFRDESGWWKRFQALQDQFSSGGTIKILQHEHISNMDDLLVYENRAVNEGYEGVILRHPNAPYKFGRSTVREGYLMKLKRFADSEAVVLEIIEELHNGNEATTNELGRTKRSSHKENKVGKGRMGALLVRDVTTGVEFQLGTGFTDVDKAWWWDDSKLGLTVKYKFFPVGVKDLPRHPVFLGVRDTVDL